VKVAVTKDTSVQTGTVGRNPGVVIKKETK
jgi:hypothetical protein